MIKKNFKCNECEKHFSLFIKTNDSASLHCTNCNSVNLNQIFSPLSIEGKNQDDATKGELSQKYIEENSMILNEMKKEIMKWN